MATRPVPMATRPKRREVPGKHRGGRALTATHVAIGIAALLACALGVYLYLGRGSRKAALTGEPLETPAEQQQRFARVCEAMRANIYRGAPMGPFDASGWVIELWLAKGQAPGPRESQAVLSAIQGGRVAPSADETLAQVADGTLTLDDSAPPLGFHDVKLVFGGGYARAFFEPVGRAHFLTLADRLASLSGAEVAALYGRCVHLPVHDVGAWFRGGDAGLAATALLYGVSLSAETRVIDRKALGRYEGSSDLAALRAAAAEAKLEPGTLRALCADTGGSILVTPSAVALSFPIDGPLRALRASRTLAQKLGIAGE